MRERSFHVEVEQEVSTLPRRLDDTTSTEEALQKTRMALEV